MQKFYVFQFYAEKKILPGNGEGAGAPLPAASFSAALIF